MKFLRFICNVLLFVFLVFGISMVQVAVFDLVAAQSPSVEAIHIVGEDEQVSYFDSYVFWGTDIATNVKQDPKVRIRNWMPWAWWHNTVGKGLDYALDTCIGVAKPIFVPIAQVNAVKNYYSMNMNSEWIRENLLTKYKSEDAANKALYELYVIYGYGYGDVNQVKMFGSDKCILEYDYPEEEAAKIIEAINKLNEKGYKGNEIEYQKWIKQNAALYNHNWKLTKYNGGEYDKFFKKFIYVEYARDPATGNIMMSSDGLPIESCARSIKTAVVVLYYQQYVSLILAFIFVLKYPIKLVQSRVEGGANDKTSVAV